MKGRPGRRPVGDKAMTSTERVRKYREAHGLGRRPGGEAALKAENRELRAELAAELRAAATTLLDLDAANAEIRRLRAQIDTLSAANTSNKWEWLNVKAARAGSDAAQVGDAVKVLLDEQRRELEAERETVRNLRARLREVAQRPKLSKGDLRVLRAALHPDGEVDPKRKQRLEHASQVFNALIGTKIVVADAG